MDEGTQLSMTDDGRLAVTKRAAGGPGAARLQREAEVLALAAHPRVVEVLGSGVADDGTVILHTAFVGGGSLAAHLGDIDPGTVPDVGRWAQVAAALAETLADLHQRGLAHQQVCADHVLMTEADHVRLCSFGGAAVTIDGSPCPPEMAAVDVEAVASLLAEMADRAGAAGAGLRAAADRVLSADGHARPSMRALAQALADEAASGDGQAPTTRPKGRILPARSPRRPDGKDRGRLGLGLGLVIAAGALVAGGVGIAVAGGPGPLVAGGRRHPAPAPADLASTTTTTALPPVRGGQPLGVRVWPEPEPEPEPDPDAVEAAEPEAVEVTAGVVSVAGRRWQVAADEDLVVVGDWDCDGLATPAVVRHGTGRVWVFARWAEGERALAATPVGTVAGAVSARAVDRVDSDDADGEEDDGCHDLELVAAEGGTTRLDLGDQGISEGAGPPRWRAGARGR